MTEYPDRIRVLTIEHNPVLRQGLSDFLAGLPDMELVGAAGSAAEGLALFEQVRPTVTVIDLELPDRSALRVVREIRNADADAPVLMLATYELDPAAAEALESAAVALLAKDQIDARLPELVRVLVSRAR